MERFVGPTQQPSGRAPRTLSAPPADAPAARALAMNTVLSLSNPLFKAYTVCTTMLALKMTAIAWHTVAAMLYYGRGNRAPEDVNKGWTNPKPKGKIQLGAFEPTDRLRRMMAHDIENNVGFFAVGLLYVCLDCGAAWPLWTYAGSKMAHHLVYLSVMSHELRATCWTFTSAAFMYMAGKVLAAALL